MMPTNGNGGIPVGAAGTEGAVSFYHNSSSGLVRAHEYEGSCKELACYRGPLESRTGED